MAKKVVIAADPFGFDLKNYIVQDLRKNGYEVNDLCPDKPMEYQEAAHQVCKTIQAGEAERGIAICGTGMGVSIVCNKHRGIYAALCQDKWQAERSKTVNNSNVLCLGGMYTGQIYGAEIANAWLKAEHLVGIEPAELKDVVKGEFQRIPKMEEQLYKNDGRDLF